ncbi:histidine-type phosphatase [Mucilaginibacter sp.]|uniref:histidine-type phosphatase n=1 Tax=Mucilaginibacter sp. TaxID=1882438 RepID=UPI003D0B8EBB
MKKIITLLSFVLTISGVAYAQDFGTTYLGTKTLYQYHAQKYTPPPAGYLPVFINHVGRHGARHLTKDVAKTYAYALLMEADSSISLTDKGKKLKQMVAALQKIEQGNTKFISAEGRDELYGLGKRMFLNYSKVFNGKVNLDVAVTKEVRTTQSANSFLSGFNSNLKDSASVRFYNDDTSLRFYDLSPAYKKFEDSVANCGLMLSLKKAVGFNELVNNVINQFFNINFITKLDQTRKEKFVSDLFGFTTIKYSLKAEINEKQFEKTSLNFESFFTCEELRKLGQIESVDENLKKGPGTDNNGIQVRVAVPLLVDFIKATDDFIKNDKYSAHLRFAHAETIAPFAALLQITTADKAAINIQSLKSNWHSSAIIPLSANIQWVFYKRKGSPDYLVKVLLNEKEAHIDGLIAYKGLFYKWAELRKFYVGKLKRLNVSLTDDMALYLSRLN